MLLLMLTIQQLQPLLQASATFQMKKRKKTGSSLAQQCTQTLVAIGTAAFIKFHWPAPGDDALPVYGRATLPSAVAASRTQLYAPEPILEPRSVRAAHGT